MPNNHFTWVKRSKGFEFLHRSNKLLRFTLAKTFNNNLNLEIIYPIHLGCIIYIEPKRNILILLSLHNLYTLQFTFISESGVPFIIRSTLLNTLVWCKEKKNQAFNVWWNRWKFNTVEATKKRFQSSVSLWGKTFINKHTGCLWRMTFKRTHAHRHEGQRWKRVEGAEMAGGDVTTQRSGFTHTSLFRTLQRAETVFLCLFVGVCVCVWSWGCVLRRFCSPAGRSSLTYSLVSLN